MSIHAVRPESQPTKKTKPCLERSKKEDTPEDIYRCCHCLMSPSTCRFQSVARCRAAEKQIEEAQKQATAALA